MRQAVRFKIKRCKMLWSWVFSNLFPSINLSHLSSVNEMQGFGAASFLSPSGGLVEQGRKLSAYTQGGTL